ncbi:MAG: hypothetical protein GQ581_02370 [Methyloprofundus sp.]|nr:hypothetical protein [Methyloprofundus sp.]
MYKLILITLSLMLFGCANNPAPDRHMSTSNTMNSDLPIAEHRNISSELVNNIPSVTMNRTALVLGNSDYKLMPLSNPKNDATDIAAKLKSLGFQVILATDKNKKEVKNLIREFGQSLKQRGGVGLFFYAGHGLQIDGKNYLVPTDFNVSAAYEVSDASIDVGLVTGAMEEANNPLNIIVLDACRDNPFPRKSRSSARGLARIKSASGTIIAYSTGPGNVAADGNGRNSPYTQYLLKFMGAQGLTIEQVFKRVRVAVENSTEGKQLPWETSSLRGDFYFKPGKLPSTPVAAYIPPPRPQPAQIIAQPKPADTKSTHARKLSIFTNPDDSDITILNSDIKYSRGVQLEPGDYRIEISKAGYISKKKWITIDKHNIDIQITLRRDYYE